MILRTSGIGVSIAFLREAQWDAIYLACPPEMRKTLLEATRSLAIHLTEFSEQNKNT